MAMDSSGLHPLADSRNKNWDQMEEQWWSQVAAIRMTEDRNIVQEHDEMSKDIRRELVNLYSERTRVATQLQMIRDEVDRKEAQLKTLEASLRGKQHDKDVERSYIDAQKRDYFRHAREHEARERAAYQSARGSVLEHQQQPQQARNCDLPYELRYPHRPRHESEAHEPHHRRENHHVMNHQMMHGRGSEQHDEQQKQQQKQQQHSATQEDGTSGIEPSHGRHEFVDDGNDGHTGAEIVDAQGTLIGPVRKLGRTNHWIAKCLELPVRQPVTIRPSRKFDSGSLAAIYEAGDAKAAKWLGVMIQATGQVQSKPCTTCVKGIGVFSQCIIIGGGELPRCGNCEWNRQACVGAAPEGSNRHTPPAPVATNYSEARPSPRQQTTTTSSGGCLWCRLLLWLWP